MFWAHTSFRSSILSLSSLKSLEQLRICNWSSQNTTGVLKKYHIIQIINTRSGSRCSPDAVVVGRLSRERYTACTTEFSKVGYALFCSNKKIIVESLREILNFVY